ncbi:MAG TPA: hypothetical protein VNO51_01210 [Ilumatobacteraceae bacterium]|nr:hypothetical protein [Ilumatobacteraceae bacterium]
MRFSRHAIAASVLLGGLVAADLPAHAEVKAIQPVRVLDTRSGVGGTTGPIAAGQKLTLPVPAAAAGASSVVLNLTADGANVDGFVIAWPCDAPMPQTSILNFTPGHAVANMVALKLPSSGLCFQSSAPVHLIGDLMGSLTGTADFQGSTPNRLLDTRSGPMVPANVERRLDVAGTAGISAGAAIAALNFTVVTPVSDGFVTVYECGSVPVASTVNFRAREVVPNFTFAKLSDGEVCFRSSVATHILVDSFGWSTGSGGLRGLQPSRVLDTRNNTWSIGPAQSGQDLRLRVAGRGGVPNEAAAALLTITVDSINGGGYVTAWPCDEAMPNASVLNLWNGTVRSNLALVKLSAETGEVCLRPTLYNGSSITLIADAVGWTPGGPARGPVPAPPTPPTPPQPGPGGKFTTLAVGAALPSEAECASRVRSASEIRAVNVPYNNTRGTNPHNEEPRVTGNFTGTTDEILQWAACKWGIDEDIVRAQIAKESYWTMDAVGDNGESFGLGQVRTTAHGAAFEDNNAARSSAYNVDYTYYRWWSCYNGHEGWLNQFERGRDYAAGDVWGCVGLWFSGRWYFNNAAYLEAVHEYLDDRIWETPPFINYTG